MMDAKPMRQARAEWTDVVLVCRKCTRKLDGGFGRKGGTSLAKALRKVLNDGRKGRKARVGVVEVGCLGLCPKGAVTAVRGTAPGRWAVVPAGMPAAEVAERLGLEIAARAAD